MTKNAKSKPHKIGLALGSGSARGWAHIGVIRQLAEAGIKPNIVCGTSIGALVGGAYCSDKLDILEDWVLQLTKMAIAKNLDINIFSGGGAIKGKRLFDFFREQIGDVAIEDLPKPFAAVATDLATGREVWLQKGSLMDAVRASLALPGLFTPAEIDGQWLVDGALVNPVPVSLCRVLGADFVIAINLNGELFRNDRLISPKKLPEKDEEGEEPVSSLTARIRQQTNQFLSHLFESNNNTPGLLDVLTSSLNIMQDRITRSRMASDFPEVMIIPKLSDIGLMEYYRAEETIEEGRASVKRALPAFESQLSQSDLN
jgi:NTE family protein